MSTTTTTSSTSATGGGATIASGSRLVQVAVVYSDALHRVTTGEATTCPHLVIVPRTQELPDATGPHRAGPHGPLGRVGFTGGFTAVHVPTGRVLPAREVLGHDVGPDLIARAVAAVAHLDWSSPDLDHYRRDRRHLPAWTDALHQHTRFDLDLDLDDPDGDLDDLTDDTSGGCLMAGKTSAYPVPTDTLIARVRALGTELGGWPSQRQVMRTCRVGAPRAEAALAALRTTDYDPTAHPATPDAPAEPAVEPAASARADTSPLSSAPTLSTPATPAPGDVTVGVSEPAAQVTEPAATLPDAPQTPTPAAPDAPGEPTPTTAAQRVRVPRWPLWLIAAGAFVAIWGGWVGLGEMVGFGPIRLLPGIADEFVINSAITLPIGMEAYAAYALRAWLAGPDAGLTHRARTFARWSALGALALGGAGQIAYHLMAAADVRTAPWPITAFVSCLPVIVLGCGAALAHLTSTTTHPTTSSEETA